MLHQCLQHFVFSCHPKNTRIFSCCIESKVKVKYLNKYNDMHNVPGTFLFEIEFEVVYYFKAIYCLCPYSGTTVI